MNQKVLEAYYDTVAACLGAEYSHYDADQRTIRSLQTRLELEFSLSDPLFNREWFQTRIEYWMNSHSE